MNNSAPSACQRLADAADRLAVDGPEPRAYLVALARQGADIRSGPLAVFDLLVGGRNPILGRGFRPELDDDTDGQVRHFVGVARSVTLLGAGPTRWISEHVRRDPRDSPDGRLTELAQRFARQVLDGDLAPSEAGDWIRRRLCN